MPDVRGGGCRPGRALWDVFRGRYFYNAAVLRQVWHSVHRQLRGRGRHGDLRRMR